MSVAFDRAAVFEAAPACSSSSLGKDSDDGSPTGKEKEVDEGEVQSAYTEVDGFTGLSALEESLPIRWVQFFLFLSIFGPFRSSALDALIS